MTNQNPVMRCIACEKTLYDGDKVLFDDCYKKYPQAICLDCYNTLEKKDLAEHLGAYFGNIRGF